MILKNSYNDNSELVKQSVAVNFLRRLPNQFELEKPDIVNDHLLSLVKKDFYVKLDGDTKMSSTNVQLSGTNNLWYNTRSNVLNF